MRPETQKLLRERYGPEVAQRKYDAEVEALFRELEAPPLLVGPVFDFSRFSTFTTSLLRLDGAIQRMTITMMRQCPSVPPPRPPSPETRRLLAELYPMEE